MTTALASYRMNCGDVLTTRRALRTASTLSESSKTVSLRGSIQFKMAIFYVLDVIVIVIFDEARDNN